MSGNCNRMLNIDNRLNLRHDSVLCIDSMLNLIQLVFWYCHNTLVHRSFRARYDYRWGFHYSAICNHRWWFESMRWIAYGGERLKMNDGEIEIKNFMFQCKKYYQNCDIILTHDETVKCTFGTFFHCIETLLLPASKHTLDNHKMNRLNEIHAKRKIPSKNMLQTNKSHSHPYLWPFTG